MGVAGGVVCVKCECDEFKVGVARGVVCGKKVWFV